MPLSPSTLDPCQALRMAIDSCRLRKHSSGIPVGKPCLCLHLPWIHIKALRMTGDSCIFRKHLLHPCGESLPLSASASASTLSGLFWFRPPLLGGLGMPHSSLLFLTTLSELSQIIVPSIPSLVCRLSPVRGQIESTTAS